MEDLYVWRITTRQLSFNESDRSMAVHYFVFGTMSERIAVQKARTKLFTAAWWDERIITEVERLGRCYCIDKEPH